VLTGIGGVGKTSLARAYAQRHFADYGIIWWIRAEDPVTIDAEFRSLLEVLLPPGQAAQVMDARTLGLTHLAQRNDSWLLVLDNVPDASSAQGLLPPAGNGHVLITSRATGWPHPIIVQPLDMPAAVKLLGAQLGDPIAEALSTELGRLPLALIQAAGFVRTAAIDTATYLRWYHERSAELLREGQPADYPRTVATTWQLTMDRLTTKASELLNLLAFYAPEAIPVSMLLTAWDEIDRHRAIGELHAYGLIFPEGSGAVTVHRLVQAVTRSRLHADLTAHEWAEAAHKLIVAALPKEPVTAVTLGIWNSLRTHVHALLDYLPSEYPNTLSTRHRAADWAGYSGDVLNARNMFIDLLPIRERVLGTEHPDTLDTRHELAKLTGQTGNTGDARDQLIELLPVRVRVLGSEHPDTLSTQHEIAYWTGHAGNPVGARELFAELSPIRARVLGAEHLNTLITMNNLAYWTGRSGNVEEALGLFAAMLPTFERVLGPEHPMTLILRQNLATWTGRTGAAAQARELLARLVTVREKVLGPEHPDTLFTRHSLAQWTGRAGDAGLAWRLLAELAPIREKVLGAQHPHTLATQQALVYWGEQASS
jgi:hypothetical protein